MSTSRKVVTRRIILPDGRIMAEARSVVVISSDSESLTDQSATVEVSSNSSRSSSSASSYSSSSASSSGSHVN